MTLNYVEITTNRLNRSILIAILMESAIPRSIIRVSFGILKLSTLRHKCDNDICAIRSSSNRVESNTDPCSLEIFKLESNNMVWNSEISSIEQITLRCSTLSVPIKSTFTYCAKKFNRIISIICDIPFETKVRARKVPRVTRTKDSQNNMCAIKTQCARQNEICHSLGIQP